MSEKMGLEQVGPDEKMVQKTAKAIDDNVMRKQEKDWDETEKSIKELNEKSTLRDTKEILASYIIGGQSADQISKRWRSAYANPEECIEKFEKIKEIMKDFPEPNTMLRELISNEELLDVYMKALEMKKTDAKIIDIIDEEKLESALRKKCIGKNPRIEEYVSGYEQIYDPKAIVKIRIRFDSIEEGEEYGRNKSGLLEFNADEITKD